MRGEKDTSELSLGRESFVGLASKLFLAVFGFVGVVVFTRVLGVGGVGKYYFLLAIAKFAVQVPGGVSAAVKKRVSEVGVDPGEYFGLGIVVVVAFSTLFLVSVLAAYPLVADKLGSRGFAIGLVAITTSLATFSLTNRLYAGIGNPGASFWADSLRSVFTLAFQVAFLVLGLRVLGLMYGFVGATLLTTLFVLVLARVRPKRPSRETAASVWAFAKWSLPNALTQNLYMRLDVLILGTVVGLGAVGFYEPALRLTVPAGLIAASIGDSLTVKASGLSSIDEAVSDDLENALSYTSLFAIPIFFGALAIPEALLVVVYGEALRPAATALVLLAVFQLFNTYRMPFDNVVDGMDRPEVRFRVSLFTLAINVPLAIGLGLEYGLLGVIVATIVAEAARTVAYIFVAYRLFDEVMIPRQVLEQIAAGAVMFGVVVLAADAVLVPNPLTLAAVVGAGAITYFSVLLALSSHFRLTIRSVLGDLGVTSIVER